MGLQLGCQNRGCGSCGCVSWSLVVDGVAEVSVRGGSGRTAGIYFKGPIKSGFTLMFIKRETDDGNPSLYPSTGACSVKTLQERYDGNGGMVDEEGNRLIVTGDDMQWFWCFPNDETQVCTIVFYRIKL